ncbi:MAG: DinB family protein [Phycisphaerales bacterium]
MNTAIEPIRLMNAHCLWFRRKMFEAAKPLSKEELERPFAMGPGSVIGIFTHCLFAETVWINAVEGNPTFVPAKQEGHPSLDEVAAAWQPITARWEKVFATTKDSDLARPVVRVREGKAYTTSLGDVLIHVTMHQHYHAAQFKNMLRQLGKSELPPSDFIMYAREMWKG